MSKMTFERDIEKDGDTITLTVEVDYSVVCDPAYGADADGNRGVKSWFLDDCRFKIMSDNVDVTDEIKKTPELYKKIQAEAEDNALDAGMNSDEDY
jgi:hypothetical protein